MDPVTLRVNAQAYGGWKSVRITAGLEAAARDFVVEVTDVWPDSGAGYTGTRAGRINAGDRVEVYIGEDLVCTGHVDATPRQYDGQGYTLAIQGRSLTADLVDSAADNPAGQWTNAPAERIARDVAGRYGVTVRNEAETGPAIIEHQIQPGETAFESLDRVARARQFLLTDNERGELVLAAAGKAGKAAVSLEFGVNILSGACDLDFSETFSEYIVRGQRKGDDEKFGKPVAESKGKADDHTIRRRRIYTIRQPGQADDGTCQDRAEYEARNRAAKAKETRYFVQGWRQTEGGPLWRPNLLVTVRDPVIGHDGELLIAQVTYFLDRDGTRSELVVIPADAFTASAEIRASEQASQDAEAAADKAAKRKREEDQAETKAKREKKKAEGNTNGLPDNVTWVDNP